MYVSCTKDTIDNGFVNDSCHYLYNFFARTGKNYYQNVYLPTHDRKLMHSLIEKKYQELYITTNENFQNFDLKETIFDDICSELKLIKMNAMCQFFNDLIWGN